MSGALTVAGSALGTVGNSFEQTIGLVTAATELMPGKAQTVGNSFRTIGINIAKMANSSDEWVAANGRVNVALKDSQGNLRSTYDIMKDLYTGVDGQSVAWKDLSEAEQNAIAVQAAGKTRYQAFVAAMSNFETAINATNTALNSQGSAERENARAMESLEGHLNQLKSAFQKFANSIISSNLLKNLIDIGAAILTFASGDVGQSILKLSLFATGIGLLSRAFLKLHGIVKGMSFLKGLKTLWLGTAKATAKQTAATIADTAATEANTAAKIKNAAAGGTTTSAKGIDKLKSSWKSLTGLIAANPLASVATAAGAVFAGVAYASSKYYDGLKKKASQARETFEGTIQKIQSNENEIDTLTNKTDKLTQKEQERLAILEKQTGELKKQVGQEGRDALTTFMQSDGKSMEAQNLKASNWGKDVEAGLKTYKEAWFNYLNATSEKQKQTAEDNMKTSKKGAKQAKKDAQDYLDLVKLIEDSGGVLTDQEKKWKKQAQETVDAYKEFKQFMDPEALKSMFPSMDFSKLSDQEIAALKDQFNLLSDAMSKSSTSGESFKKAMDGVGDKLGELGKYDAETKQYTFDNTNIQDYADALGISTEAAQELLKTQTELGNVKWDIPQDRINTFNENLKGLESTLTTTDGKMFTSESRLRELANAMGIPEAAIPTFIQGYKDAGNTLVDFSGNSGDVIKSLEQLGDASGLVYDEAGKLAGVDLSKFAKNIKDAGGSQEDLANLLTYLSQIEGFDFGDEYNGLITGAESASQAAKDLWGDIDAIPPITESTVVMHTEESGEGLKSLKKEVKGFIEEPKDTTITVVDDATGVIHQVKLEALDFEDAAYVARLTGDDQASNVIAYAKDRAEGYTGDYWSWLKANDKQAYDKAMGAIGNNKKFANGKYESKLTAKDNTAPGVNSAKAQLKTIRDKRVTITAVVSGIGKAAAAISGIAEAAKPHAKGKRRGEKGGLAWVGDEGSKSNPKPELIQTQSGAYLAGTQGWEQVYLDDGDIVYSASDTRKLLAGDKRLTDRFIRRRASGTPKFLSSDSDSDSVKKAIEAWSNQVSSWEHNVDIGRATQSQYVNWLKSQYKISNKMTEDQYRSAEKTIWDYYEAFEEAALENYLTSLKYGKLTLDQTLNYINQSRKAQKITQEKADELTYEAHKNHIEWKLEEFKNDKATYEDTKKLVLDFYNYQKKYGKMSLEDYYGYLDDLADATQEKELDRLEKLQEREENQQDLAKKYAQLQVDNIEKQIDALDKQNEAQDKANELAELYNDLAEARSKRVRIYREGVGFVYEQDTKAIKDAQKAISDFEAENAADSLEALKQQWQDILDMFDDQDALADIKELENALGMTSKELFGDMGTNLKQWTEWYKNTVSTGMGLEDIITQLDDLSGWDKISNYLNSEGKVDWSKLKDAIEHNRFANGTTNAKGGFSIVGEKGWELGLLNQGDAIFPHEISKNLMEWGKYSPNQYKLKETDTGRVETYNFDKLVLPNVSNANEFVNELKKLPNLAIQRSGRR